MPFAAYPSGSLYGFNNYSYNIVPIRPILVGSRINLGTTLVKINCMYAEGQSLSGLLEIPIFLCNKLIKKFVNKRKLFTINDA